jgi:ribosomal protein S18 acetylase RimI-like enzyme
MRWDTKPDNRIRRASLLSSTTYKVLLACVRWSERQSRSLVAFNRIGCQDRAMPPVVIRPATTADVDAVLAFWRLAAENTNRTDTAEAVQRLLARDPAALILADHGGEIVGSVIAGWDGWRCHLYRFAVHPDRRRQGIGRALLDTAEQRFVHAGSRRADAMVLADNELAHRAWAASGYVRQPEWARWIKALPALDREPLARE